jgi:hypothetical protein
VRSARRRQRTTLLVGGIVAIVLGTAVSPAAAAGPRQPDTTAGTAVTTRLPASVGRSAAGRRVDMNALRGSATRTVAPGFAPVVPQPFEGLIQRSPASPTSRSPGATGSPAHSDATIPTTTTVQVTPANPVIFPTKIHVTATITPAPQPFEGFLPAVGFYVDGEFRDSSPPLTPGGVGEVDLPLGPGTFNVTAQFLGLGDYQASSSAPSSVTVVQKPDLAAEQGSAALQSSQGFEAERHSRIVAATSPSIGVGPAQMITMNERESTFYDRSGMPLFHVSTPDFFFIEPPTGQANDTPRGARIVFSQLYSRWFATEVTHDAFSGKGHVYLEFSTTADALTSDWWVYRFDFNNEAPRNPAIGVSSGMVAIGYDAATIDTSTELGSTVLVVDLSQLFALPNVVNFNRSPLGPTVHTWRPAMNRSFDNGLHAVGWTSSTDPGHIVAMTVTGSVTGGGVTFDVADLAPETTGLPDLGAPNAVGPTDAFWAPPNHLWFVSTRTCLPTGDIFTESCVRVTELDTSDSYAVQQDFVIGTNGYANFLGGIGTTDDGAVVITYSQASSGPSPNPNPISTWATVQSPGDPANSVRPSQLIAAGEPMCSGPNCILASWNLTHLSVATDPYDQNGIWQASLVSVPGGWATEATRLTRGSNPPDGTFVLAGGRPATNALRLGIAPTPDYGGTATQVLISNSPTTAGGVLANATAGPIDGRIAWSLADPAFGGSSATGSRTVYLQWGDGRGTWSAVEHHAINVSTPLGADFVQLNPARLLDTRVGNGLSGALVSKVPRSFQVTGRGGVPANAVAVTGNLTITGQTTSGYVFLGPTAGANPTSSTLNAPKGDTRANGVTVKLGPGGKLGAVFVGTGSAKTHLIFDVTGYLLADDPNAPKGATYVPIDPVRALDTRLYGAAGRFHSHVPRTFCVTGCVPVPDDAIAVTGNLTVTRQSSGGYLFLGPSPTTHPGSSTLNFPAGDNRANNVTVGLDANGNLSAVFVGSSNSSTTDVIFDITGYFVKGPWGATFIPLNPARILDTRFGTGLVGPYHTQVPRSFAVAGMAGIPANGTVAITGNLTLARQTTGGYAFLGPSAPSNPTSSTINVPLGDTRANGLDVGLANDGTLAGVWVGGASSTTDMIFDVLGYFR